MCRFDALFTMASLLVVEAHQADVVGRVTPKLFIGRKESNQEEPRGQNLLELEHMIAIATPIPLRLTHHLNLKIRIKT